MICTCPSCLRYYAASFSLGVCAAYWIVTGRWFFGLGLIAGILVVESTFRISLWLRRRRERDAR